MFKTHLRRIVRRPVFNKLALSGPSHAYVRTGRCVALVDARFLTWLMQGAEDREGTQPLAPLGDLLAMLALSLRQAGLEVDVVRAYWYTDQPQTQPVDDLLLRFVLDPDTDGGVSLMKALGGDMVQLAAHQAAEHILVVSDDERLLASVDQAQMNGASVHMLMDAAGHDFDKLQRDDPSWARLLAQADRRVLMVSAPAGTEVQQNEVRLPTALDTADIQTSITLELQAWWDEETETQRVDLQDELRFSRSIPQEVDRQLLLRLSRNLGHPLSWPEKKVMRENVRRIVLGDAFTPYKSEAGLGGALPCAEAIDSGAETPVSWRAKTEPAL